LSSVARKKNIKLADGGRINDSDTTASAWSCAKLAALFCPAKCLKPRAHRPQLSMRFQSVVEAALVPWSYARRGSIPC
jgi:hypothetical protein